MATWGAVLPANCVFLKQDGDPGLILKHEQIKDEMEEETTDEEEEEEEEDEEGQVSAEEAASTAASGSAASVLSSPLSTDSGAGSCGLSGTGSLTSEEAASETGVRRHGEDANEGGRSACQGRRQSASKTLRFELNCFDNNPYFKDIRWMDRRTDRQIHLGYLKLVQI